MNRRLQEGSTSSDGVSLLFALPTAPSSADAFNAAMLAVLEAGFGFGREWAGQLASSYDPQGEKYAPAICMPAGSFTTAHAALRCVAQVSHQYNRSIALSFGHGVAAVPVTARVYDEPNMLVVSLDWAPTAWQQLVTCDSARSASVALLGVGRMLFALLPVWWVMIGPAALLSDLATLPNAADNTRMPVVLCRANDLSLQQARLRTAHVESVPGGVLVVRCWNVGKRAPLDLPGRMRGRRRAAPWRANRWNEAASQHLPRSPRLEDGSNAQNTR